MSTSSRVRMSPENRREQLLELGTRLLSTRPLEELSIELLAEEAGISRGLLYHYFGNKQEFHLAVVHRAVDDLVALTAPRDIEDPLEQLAASLSAYLDYVRDNYAGYVSLVRAAAGGNEDLRRVYDEGRRVLTERIFDVAGPEALAALGIVSGPADQLLLGGWSALVEEVAIGWVADPCGLSREDLIDKLVGALAAVL
jgi:AcrR family transcriptional regulator